MKKQWMWNLVSIVLLAWLVVRSYARRRSVTWKGRPVWRG